MKIFSHHPTTNHSLLSAYHWTIKYIHKMRGGKDELLCIILSMHSDREIGRWVTMHDYPLAICSLDRVCYQSFPYSTLYIPMGNSNVSCWRFRVIPSGSLCIFWKYRSPGTTVVAGWVCAGCPLVPGARKTSHVRREENTDTPGPVVINPGAGKDICHGGQQTGSKQKIKLLYLAHKPHSEKD